MIATLFSALFFSSAVNTAPEAELAAKLPEIFAKSAAHYKALDAAATPQMKGAVSARPDRANGDLYTPHGWKKWQTGKDELDMRSIFWWTSGHYPGSLWYLYEATGDAFFKDRATAWTEILAPNSKVTDNHDVGFIMYCSFGNARRLLKTDKYDALLVETAESLCKRYNDKLGLIRSWGALDEKKDFLVIPDNLMNLELLEFAASLPKPAGEKRVDFNAIACSHADATMKHHFRADGGCFHVLDYDQTTGRVKGVMRGQGASCETAWSRGESWAIYGYTMMYRTTGYVRYLDFAKKLADYAINHPNMPADGIPCWDYGAPGEERDTSAGAIMASALVELSQYVGAADRDRYRAFAVKQLLALSSDAYFSKGGEVGHFLLKHGVGHKPGESEVDTPLDYGDYYFLEALLRFRALLKREAAIAAKPGIAALPPKAALAADELAMRSRTVSSDVLPVARRALAEPIPDTSDALYGEFWENGNRSRYQDRFFARLQRLDALTAVAAGMARMPDAPPAEKLLARIEEFVAAICDMKSWVLPAHDWPDGGKGTWRGEWITADLFSTEVAAHLACVVQALGNKLRPETVARVKENAERRVFAPVRRETPMRLYGETAVGGVRATCLWWIDCGNNWNSVCWDNVVCAACGLIDDPADRAFFVASADTAADRYVADGFAADGYCSEGMGYWNYGFGHHLLTGRLLDRITGGKLNFFWRPKQRLAAAYARAYTLREGASPAFADGNGAASPRLLALVDEFWPDLPKALPPASEFADGQVWLLRDPEHLSVAFKGGHNDELHNHNDLGSYYVMAKDLFVAGDPGAEEYTRRTFSGQRYESKVLNSYGHPVPVVGGKLQSTGRAVAAKVLSKKLDGDVATVVLDLKAAYDVKTLKELTRTFVYDRKAKTFTVRDHVAFSAPTAFESPFNTYLEAAQADRRGDCRTLKMGWGVRPEITVTGGAYSLVEEDVANPGHVAPRRVAVRFDKPVAAADVSVTYRAPNP